MNSAKQRILLVDDDTSLLGLLTLRLNATGYQVATAESGKDALAHLSVFRPQMVITDLRMDGMDGMALSEIIHKRHPGMPIIILTAHGTIPEAVTAIKGGVFSFLSKPFDTKVLLSHIEKALQWSGYPQDVEEETRTMDWRKGITSHSPIMEELLNQAHMVASSDTSVYINGETGTGKEVLARAIHRASPRRDRPFVEINCSAIPEALLESELFGYCKGAFTGASQDRKGLFQVADSGTLFLDEIGDMPPALQPKLLRALQDKQIRPLGTNRSLRVDVRIISASHCNLEKEIETGRFREDLYYRLVVLTLEVPPLSKRREDIPLLARHFLSQLTKKSPREITGFSPEAMKLLLRASWPGNVRQLLNVIEQAFTLSVTPIITAALIQKAIRNKHEDLPSFRSARDRFERDYLVQLLQITLGNVSHAADIAKRNRTEFYKLLSRHKLDPSLFRHSS
ncbi:sigma 54-interacting transcriptional regulator [bacterium AH-315-L15]|nr:sigma 54-interacting transcriptional regulator [bacterium AH-315-L15]